MTTYDTDNFVELLGFINAEAGRLIGSPVPYHNSQYFLPVTDHSGCGDLTAASEKVALRTAKPSRLSDLLAHITGRIPKEAKVGSQPVISFNLTAGLPANFYCCSLHLHHSSTKPCLPPPYPPLYHFHLKPLINSYVLATLDQLSITHVRKELPLFPRRRK